MEDQIVSQLSVPKEELTPVPPITPDPPKEEPKEDESFHDNLPLENTLEKMRLMDYFEIPQISRYQPEVATWLDQVIEWARTEAGSSEFTDMLRIINDQERIMGNKLKQDRLSKLANFVKINSQRRKLAEMERALYL